MRTVSSSGGSSASGGARPGVFQALAFFSCLALAGCNEPPKKSDAQLAFEKDLAQLAQEGAKTAGDCTRFAAALESLLKNGGPDGVLKAREAETVLYGLLKSYGGVPEATRRMADKVLNEGKGTDWDITPLLKANFCANGAAAGGLRTLVASANPLKLPSAEKNRIRDLALAQLARELRSTLGISSLLAQAGLLNALVDEKLLTVSDPIFVELVRFDKESGDLKSDVGNLLSKRDFPEQYRDAGELAPPQKEFLNEVLIGELDKCDGLRHKLARLVDRVAP